MKRGIRDYFSPTTGDGKRGKIKIAPIVVDQHPLRRQEREPEPAACWRRGGVDHDESQHDETKEKENQECKGFSRAGLPRRWNNKATLRLVTEYLAAHGWRLDDKDAQELCKMVADIATGTVRRGRRAIRAIPVGAVQLQSLKPHVADDLSLYIRIFNMDSSMMGVP